MNDSKHLEQQVVKGNAHDDGKDTNSWFVGHFVEQEGRSLCRSNQVEVQLRHHVPGNRKQGWAWNKQGHTLVLLIRGRFVVELPSEEIVLEREGDYVIWPPQLNHSWRAEKETLVVTVRWPSLPDDQEPDKGA